MNTSTIPVLNSVINIAEFVTLTFQQNVSHIEFDGKQWYPWTTNWYKAQDDEDDTDEDEETGSEQPCSSQDVIRQWFKTTFKRGEHDPDFPCYGYSEHALQEGEEDGEAYEEAAHHHMAKKHPQKSEEIRHRFYGEKDIKWRDSDVVAIISPIIVTRDVEENCDHRGSNHMALDLARTFEDNIKIDPGIYGVTDLMDILWRTKCNKFDNQYEIFLKLVHPYPEDQKKRKHFESFAIPFEENGRKVMLVLDGRSPCVIKETEDEEKDPQEDEVSALENYYESTGKCATLMPLRGFPVDLSATYHVALQVDHGS